MATGAVRFIIIITNFIVASVAVVILPSVLVTLRADKERDGGEGGDRERGGRGGRESERARERERSELRNHSVTTSGPPRDRRVTILLLRDRPVITP